MKSKRLSRLPAVLLFLAITAPAIAYIPQAMDVDGTIATLRWSSSSGFPIEWRMNPTVGSNVSGTREQLDVFAESFQEWADIPTAAITFVQGPATAADVVPEFDQINLITTNVTPAEFNAGAVGLAVSYAFSQIGVDQFGRQVEFPGHILETDIMFNPETSFSLSEDAPSDRIDLQSVATHEIGHLLGLDHTNLLSSTMFPSIVAGASYPRETQLDDRIGISTLYPAPGFGSTTGTLSGTVRTTANMPVYGALVVAVDPGGQAVASTFSDPNGQYSIAGLAPAAYTVYAEPMNQPFSASNLGTLGDSYPGQVINTNFTVRFR